MIIDYPYQKYTRTVTKNYYNTINFNPSNVEILVKNKPIQKFFHEKNTYVEGRKGSEFSIRIRNPNSTRIKVVVSVDGLSIIDGLPAGENSPGFVINAYDTQIFTGWMKDQNTVNKFYFSSKERSYSERTEQGSENVGVIGVMAFAEVTETYSYQTPIYWNSFSSPTKSNGILRSYGMNSMHAGISASAASDTVGQNIGTGYGEEEEFKTKTTTFEQSYSEPKIVAIYYDDRKGLEKRGIVFSQKKEFPNAFPNAKGIGCPRPLK